MVKNAVRLIRVPSGSGIHHYLERGDFVDCYCVTSKLPVRRAAEIIVQYPGWVKILMLIRKAVTAPFGLVNDTSGDKNTIGIFPIETESEDEILAGFDDRHLNFRIAIGKDQGEIYFATWVRTHNTGGDLYLSGVMPFHILICRNALTRVANAST